jgi:hypothetical protein
MTLTSAGTGRSISTSGSSKSGTSNTFTVNQGANLGDATLESGTGTRATNYIEAWDKFTIAAPTMINSFVLYQNVAGGTGNMNVGLYTDSGSNRPSSLVSGSDSGSIAVSSSTGWITYTYTTPFNLPAGTYWIAFTFSANNPTGWVRRNSIWTQCYVTPFMYGPLPSSFPSNPSVATNGPISMYYTCK